MKKIIIVLLCTLLPLYMFAETNKDKVDTKKNTQIKFDAKLAANPASASQSDFFMPTAGTFSLGVDMVSILNGNMNNQTISFRYFLNQDMALRVKIGGGLTNISNKGYVRDDALFFKNNLSTATVDDKQVKTSTSGNISLGLQMYKRYGKASIFYGADLGWKLTDAKYEYTYANPITAINTIPFSYNFNGNVRSSNRMLTKNNGYKSIFTGALFLGGEYAIMPRLALGAEFSLNFAYQMAGQENYRTEEWDGNKVMEKDVPSRKFGSMWSVETLTPASYGNFYLSFYF